MMLDGAQSAQGSVRSGRTRETSVLVLCPAGLVEIRCVSGKTGAPPCFCPETHCNVRILFGA